MTSDEKLGALAIASVAILLSLIAGCTYQYSVILPQKMAEKGMCWRQNDIMNQAPSYSWQPCLKPAEAKQ